MTTIKCFAISLMVSMLFFVQLTMAENSIRDYDFKTYLSEAYKDCREYTKEVVYINSIDYFDLDGDGREEVIVTASSCYTGTAGPDIHAVYRLDKSGQPVELKVNDNKGIYEGKQIYDGLVGNRNYSFSATGGYLIAKYSDCSGQDNPLTVYFKWNGREFMLSRVVLGPVYRTSFDCGKVKSDAEKTICRNQDLANADLRMAKVYKALTSRLSGREKNTLREDQREWLKNRDKECNYKWVLECLKEKYSKRVDELETWK